MMTDVVAGTHWEIPGNGPCRLYHTVCGEPCAIMRHAPRPGDRLMPDNILMPRGLTHGDRLFCMSCGDDVLEGQNYPEWWDLSANPGTCPTDKDPACDT